jgi:hypothetical protein
MATRKTRTCRLWRAARRNARASSRRPPMANRWGCVPSSVEVVDRPFFLKSCLHFSVRLRPESSVRRHSTVRGSKISREYGSFAAEPGHECA